MRAPRTVEAFAPAKLNLALHVTGRRADGYHLLDSLVVFANVGDVLTLRPTAATTLQITGPMAAGVPADPSNLVLRAAGLFDPPVHAEITLEKHLPAAAGIGGGSSDAAACLVALASLTSRAVPPPQAILGLGADVPVCLSHAPQRMRGIGETLDPVPPLPPLWAVLVNPRLPVPTGLVFAALDRADNPVLPDDVPEFRTAAEFCDWLATQRNDLQPAALAIRPEIGACLSALSELRGCLLARMSGSGATCFGLFASETMAVSAAEESRQAHPYWWCAAAPLLNGGDPLTPRPQFNRATT